MQDDFSEIEISSRATLEQASKMTTVTLKPNSVPLVGPAAGRACDGCTLCCKVMGITALTKPRGKWCSHCDIGVGCKIYDSRPDECRSFLCGWLANAAFGPEWKPDKSRLVITTTAPNQTEFHCDPGMPGAWRKEPYYSRLLDMARAAEPYDGLILIIIGNNTTVLTPQKEFPLGHLKEDEQIVREASGLRVVNVRVVKAPPRANVAVPDRTSANAAGSTGADR